MLLCEVWAAMAAALGYVCKVLGIARELGRVWYGLAQGVGTGRESGGFQGCK